MRTHKARRIFRQAAAGAPARSRARGARAPAGDGPRGRARPAFALLERPSAAAPPGRVTTFVRQMRGAGRPLGPAARAFFEARIGRSLRRVRIHTGDAAAAAARAVNARAFTVGRHVAFGAGEYAPHTPAGRRLLAHELAHTAQPGAGQHVRRKILIGGKAYSPKGDYGWVGQHYGSAMVEFLKSMYNDNKAPNFEFTSFGQMHREIRVRHHATKGMAEVHKGCCSYPTGGGTGKLDATYWKKLGPYQFEVKKPLPAGKDAADAVEAIFKSGAGTELECNSTMVAIQYRAMLKALGADKFNKKFPAGAGIIISPHHRPPAGHVPHPIWDKKLFKQVTISSAADLLPGDWVYFKNVLDYSTRHPGGFWTGEHAMYLGGGKFRGFGVKEMTETELNKDLLKAYNTGLPAADQKTLADVPGLQDYARRPEIEEITK